MEEATVTDLFTAALQYATKDIEVPPPPPIQWIEENFIDPVTKKLVVLAPHQKRIIRKALQMNEDGKSKYDLVVWSEPKKSGKTTVAAAVGCYVVANIEAPNEVSCVANDKEQSAGRIYAAMQPTLRSLNWDVPASKKGEKRDPASYGPNESIVKAITTNYGKEAGANQGLSLWSELWAYKGERLTRLWEEMTPPPTRKFRMRWVESYAGFIGENLLFQSIYLRVFQEFYKREDFEIPGKVKLQPGVRQIWPDLPVYEVDSGHTLVYWSHTPRMEWQTRQYYITQAADLRTSSFRRLHKNEWVSSDEKFISEEMWRNSISISYDTQVPATYALDASKNNDCTALVGCIEQEEFVNTVDVTIWELDGVQEVNFSEIEKKILHLFHKGLLKPPLYYDPYQCVKLAQDLRKKGVPCDEFKQGSLRIKSDTFLFKLYKEGKIRNFPHETLRRHILAASAKVYTDQRVRIIKLEYKSEVEGKDEDSDFEVYNKVDGAVAQSMAAYACYHRVGGGWAKSGL